MALELIRVAAERNDVAVLHYGARRTRRATIVAGHGYSSSKHNLDFLLAFLAGHGFESYSLDFPGHKLGGSGGMLRGVDDCIDAMSAVVQRAFDDGAADVYTLGHSMGAMTALFTAALDARVTGTVSIATGYGRPSALNALRAAGATDFRSAYVDGVTLPELVENVDQRYDELLPKLAGRPVLYVAARRDAMVNAASVQTLYERAPQPKSFETIESDHTYAADHSRSAVLAWLDARHPRH